MSQGQRTKNESRKEVEAMTPRTWADTRHLFRTWLCVLSRAVRPGQRAEPGRQDTGLGAGPLWAPGICPSLPQEKGGPPPTATLDVAWWLVTGAETAARLATCIHAEKAGSGHSGLSPEFYQQTSTDKPPKGAGVECQIQQATQQSHLGTGTF